MNISIDKNKVKLYLWIGLVFSLLYFFHDLSNYDTTMIRLISNNIWRTFYLIVMNFIFFEFTVPFVLKKRRYIIYNILLAILFLQIHMLLWSFGLYSWRLLGTALHIYTPLISFKSSGAALESQMSFSVSSV